MPLLVACQPSVAMIRFQAKPAEAEKLQAELVSTRMPEAIASIELPILGGVSLQAAADDESKLLERTAVMRIVEQYDAIASKGDSIIARGLRTRQAQATAADQAKQRRDRNAGNEDLNRVDPSELNAESLIYLLQRSQQVSATPAVRRFAKRMIEVELTEEQQPAKLLAYMTLINASDKQRRIAETVGGSQGVCRCPRKCRPQTCCSAKSVCDWPPATVRDSRMRFRNCRHNMETNPR